jgi:glycosyltransferase involved in cell wall biosynthesis
MKPFYQFSKLPPPLEGMTGWPWTGPSQESESQVTDLSCLPSISIVTPSFNQGRFIEETIRSVLLQGYPNLEYIVVDGGSTDNTLEILNKYDGFITWISEPDDGQTDAINKGLKLATGEIVAYLNSDDVYEPEAFLKVAQLFCQEKKISMVYGDIIHIDEGSHFIEIYRPGTIRLEEYLGCGVYLPQPTVFFRKRVMEEIGFFDKSLNLAMDFDYWMRIFLRFKTQYIPVSLAAARMYPNAKSSALSLGYLKEHLYILHKNFSDDLLAKSAFKSRESLRRLKMRSYSSVHLIGGLNHLRKRHYISGFYHTLEGLLLNPKNLLREDLYWSIAIAFLGETRYEHIKKMGPANWFRRVLSALRNF